MSIRTTVGAALAGALLIAAVPGHASGVSGNVTFASNYMFRGISQTDNTAAIQGGLQVSMMGIYAGMWGSNVDFHTPGDGSMEFDVYGGYKDKLSDNAGLDMGVVGYNYPGASGDLHYSYMELYAGGHYRWVSLKDYYSFDYFGGTGKADYIDLGFDYPLPYGMTLGLHAGRQYIANNTKAGIPDYNDYSVGISAANDGYGFSLKYTNTNIGRSHCPTDACMDKLVASISKTF